MQVNKSLSFGLMKIDPNNPWRGGGERSAQEEKKENKVLGLECVHKRCEFSTLGLVFILDVNLGGQASMDRP